MQVRSGSQAKESDDVRQRIVEAAEELFANKGFAASSISDISAAADVNRALIYYYFKDKQDLYNSILREGEQNMLRIAMDAYSSERTAVARLQKFITNFSRVRIERENFGRIVLRGLVDSSMEVTSHLEESFNKVSAILKLIIEEGVESKELRNVDPDMMVHTIHGMVHSLYMFQCKNKVYFDFEKSVEHTLGVLAKGIVN